MQTERGVLAYPRGDLTIQLASEKGDIYKLEDLESFSYSPEFDLFVSAAMKSNEAIGVWSQKRMARKSGCSCHGRYIEVRTLKEDTLREWIEREIGFDDREPHLMIYNGFAKPEGMEMLLPQVYSTERPCNKMEGDPKSRKFEIYRSLDGCQFLMGIGGYIRLDTSVVVLSHEEGDVAYQVLHPATAQQTGEFLRKIDETGHNQMVFMEETSINVPYRSCSDRCASRILTDVLHRQLRNRILLNMVSNIMGAQPCFDDDEADEYAGGPEEPGQEG